MVRALFYISFESLSFHFVMRMKRMLCLLSGNVALVNMLSSPQAQGSLGTPALQLHMSRHFLHLELLSQKEIQTLSIT